MATPPRALPVRYSQLSWRTIVVEADPEFVSEGLNPIEYEFNGGKTVKRGYYQKRGPYAED